MSSRKFRLLVNLRTHPILPHGSIPKQPIPNSESGDGTDDLSERNHHGSTDARVTEGQLEGDDLGTSSVNDVLGYELVYSRLAPLFDEFPHRRVVPRKADEAIREEERSPRIRDNVGDDLREGGKLNGDCSDPVEDGGVGVSVYLHLEATKGGKELGGEEGGEPC